MRRLLLVTILLLAAGYAQAADTVVVVLDASGSMDEVIPLKTGERMEKMQVAKLALGRTLLNLPPETKVGVLVFSSSNLSYGQEWVYPIANVNKDGLNRAIQTPSPGGGTPLGEYIKKGADALLAERAKNRGYGNYTLVVVTDGVATDGDLVEQYVPSVMARGIRLNVIGLAIKPDALLAKRVSLYQSADDLESLTAAVQKAVAEVPAGKDGTIDPSWFGEIEPLPQETAAAALTALNTTMTQNQPIGEQPKVVTQVDDQGNVSQIQNPEVNQSDGLGFFAWVGILFVIILGVGIVLYFIFSS